MDVPDFPAPSPKTPSLPAAPENIPLRTFHPLHDEMETGIVHFDPDIQERES